MKWVQNDFIVSSSGTFTTATIRCEQEIAIVKKFEARPSKMTIIKYLKYSQIEIQSRTERLTYTFSHDYTQITSKCHNLLLVWLFKMITLHKIVIDKLFDSCTKKEMQLSNVLSLCTSIV